MKTDFVKKTFSVEHKGPHFFTSTVNLGTNETIRNIPLDFFTDKDFELNEVPVNTLPRNKKKNNYEEQPNSKIKT